MKKHFWKLEYSITLFVFLGLLLIFFPFTFEDYMQAQMSEDWVEQYQKYSYVFSAIKAQKSEEVTNFALLKTSKDREESITHVIKPYLRLSNDRKVPKAYKPKFLNHSKIQKNDDYYFDNFYFSKHGKIIGIKETQNKEGIAFSMMVDINGFLLPNTWGKDIYGFYISENWETKPFGYGEVLDLLNNNCSSKGTGVECSYLYLIGGELNE